MKHLTLTIWWCKSNMQKGSVITIWWHTVDKS